MRSSRIDVARLSTSSTSTNHIATAIGMLSQGASRFGISVLIGRLGGASSLGLVASALSFAQIIALIWPAPNAASASKFIPRAQGRSDQAEVWAISRHLSRRALVAAALLGALAAGTWMVTFGPNWQASAIIFLLVVGYSGQATVNGFSYAARQNRTSASWDATAAVLALFGVAALLLCDVSGIALALPLGVVAIIQTALRWPLLRGAAPAPPLRREIDRFVAINAIGMLSSAGFYQFALVVAALSEGQRGAGLYAAGMALATPLSIVATSMSTVMFPAVAEAAGRADTEELRWRTEQSFRIIALVVVGATGVLAISSRVVVDFVWGPSFEVTAKLLPVILGGITFTALASPCVTFLMNHSQRHALLATAISISSSLIGVAIWVVGSLMSIAVGFLAAKAIFAVTTMILTHRTLPFLQWRWLGGLALGIAVAVLLSILAHHVSGASSAVLAVAFLVFWVLLNFRDALIVSKTVFGLTYSRGRCKAVDG